MATDPVISTFHNEADSHAKYLDNLLKSAIAENKKKNINDNKLQLALSQFTDLCEVHLIPKLNAFAAEENITGYEDITNFEQMKSQLKGYIETLIKVEPILAANNVTSPKFKARLEKIIKGLKALYEDESKKRAIKVFFKSDSTTKVFFESDTTTKDPINNTEWDDSANGNIPKGKNLDEITQRGNQKYGNHKDDKKHPIQNGENPYATQTVGKEKQKTNEASNITGLKAGTESNLMGLNRKDIQCNGNSYEQEYKKLKSQYQELENQNEKLKTKCDNMTKDAGYRDKFNQLSSSYDQMAAGNDELKKKYRKMLDDATILNKRLGDADLHIQELATK